MNVLPTRQKVPPDKAVGVWTPLSDELQLVNITDVDKSAVEEWVASVSAEMATKLPNEDEVHTGT